MTNTAQRRNPRTHVGPLTLTNGKIYRLSTVSGSVIGPLVVWILWLQYLIVEVNYDWLS